MHISGKRKKMDLYLANTAELNQIRMKMTQKLTSEVLGSTEKSPKCRDNRESSFIGL